MVSNQGIEFKIDKQKYSATGNENGGLKATDGAIKNDNQFQTIF